MKSVGAKFPAFVLALVLVACQTGFHFNRTATQKLADLETAFRHKNEWLIQQKLDALAAVLHKKVKFGHSNGWVQTYSDIVLPNNTDSLVYFTIDIHSAQFEIENKIGIVTGQGVFSGRVKKHDFNMHLHFIETWIYQKNKWLLLARQSTKLPV